MNSTEAILALVRSGRGTRPQSLASAEAEEVLNIALSLLIELAASNDRIDRLERRLAAMCGLSLETIREAPMQPAELAQRQEAVDALLHRALRIMLDPRAVTSS